MIIDLEKELIDSFINPRYENKVKQLFKGKDKVRNELQEKFNKSIVLKDFIKSQAWVEFQKPRIIDGLKSSFGKIIRDGLTMNEVELKAIISEMRTSLSLIAEMRYAIDTGEEAGRKLKNYEN